ncbi:hypothetical protein DFH27DRAFT_339158 [Peziza echinospora]|nr:hypothetical protein DFH27DRAFT_339158 [Peziza echinospora]
MPLPSPSTDNHGGGGRQPVWLTKFRWRGMERQAELDGVRSRRRSRSRVLPARAAPALLWHGSCAPLVVHRLTGGYCSSSRRAMVFRRIIKPGTNKWYVPSREQLQEISITRCRKTRCERLESSLENFLHSCYHSEALPSRTASMGIDIDRDCARSLSMAAEEGIDIENCCTRCRGAEAGAILTFRF